MAKILSDASFISEIISGIIPSFLINIGRFIAYGIVLFLLNVQLTLIVFGFIPVYYAIFRKYSKEISRSSRKERIAYSETLQSLKEKLDGHVSVKKFSSAAFFLDIFSRDAEHWFSKIKSVIKNQNKYEFVYGYFTSLIPLIVLFVGAYLTFLDLIDLGTLIAYFTSCKLIFEPISNISSNLGYSTQAIAPAERVLSLLEESEPEKSGGIHLSSVEEVVFDNVFFRYDLKYILAGVTFTIARGDVVGIVGWSGAGKSTITKLLIGFYYPEKGKILINGTPLREYSIEDLRKCVILVTQQEYIFDLSIKDNIKLGLDCDEKDIEKIMKICALDELIPLMNATVGEMGKTLSDGQKQRIALARALVRNCDVLVLDEALSAVDSERESRIIKNIKEYLPDLLLLIISHRLSTIRQADTILVLKDGVLVSKGTHEHLLEYSSDYQDLIEDQLI